MTPRQLIAVILLLALNMLSAAVVGVTRVGVKISNWSAQQADAILEWSEDR